VAPIARQSGLHAVEAIQASGEREFAVSDGTAVGLVKIAAESPRWHWLLVNQCQPDRFHEPQG